MPEHTDNFKHDEITTTNGRTTSGQFTKDNPWAWQPGECPNPGGRPQKRPIQTQLRKMIEKADGPELAKAMAELAYREALKGDFRFWKEIVDRLDGPVSTVIEGMEGGGITFNIVEALPLPSRDA